MNKNTFSIFFAGFLTTIFLSLPSFAMAIGQASSPIIIENAVRGQEYEDVLTLFNSSDEEEHFSLSAEGEIAEWLTFYKLDDATNPIKELDIAANSRLQAKVRISVPTSAPMGKQSGLVVFALLNKLKEGETNSNPVMQQVSREVTVNVNDQGIVSAEAFVSLKKNIISRNEPLEINVAYYNSGSVSSKPQIRLGIFKNDINIEDIIFPYFKDKRAIMPMQTEKMSVIWQSAGQETGRYRAEVSVMSGDQIMKEDSFAFQISDENFNSLATANVVKGFTNANFYLWIALGVAFLLVLIFVTVKIFNKKVNQSINFKNYGSKEQTGEDVFRGKSF